MNDRTADKAARVQASIYGSTTSISVLALGVVGIMEIVMLVYSFINLPLYHGWQWRYRAFYISLLAVAAAYLILNRLAKRDMARRRRWLRVANPVCALFFFAWALGVTYSDASYYGAVDATIFMTFSLIVPLSFYLAPVLYAVIVVLADAGIMAMAIFISDSLAPLINLGIFAIFQIVLGVSFMLLRLRYAQRVIEELDSADIDVLTGFSNRRVYTRDLKRLAEQGVPDGLVYLSLDVNGLKETNDSLGHDAGDRLLAGAAKCIAESFGADALRYRVGGDEFVVLLTADEAALEEMLAGCAARMAKWSEENGIALSTANGCAAFAECPGGDAEQVARIADERMYAAKAHHYRASGRDRRRAE